MKEPSPLPLPFPFSPFCPISTNLLHFCSIRFWVRFSLFHPIFGILLCWGSNLPSCWLRYWIYHKNFRKSTYRCLSSKEHMFVLYHILILKFQCKSSGWWTKIEQNCVYTVKNNRNFTDPVMGNCDKESTGKREFTGNCPYILYINSQFTVLLQIFRNFTGNWPFFTRFTVYSSENLLQGNAPFFQITGQLVTMNSYSGIFFYSCQFIKGWQLHAFSP